MDDLSPERRTKAHAPYAGVAITSLKENPPILAGVYVAGMGARGRCIAEICHARRGGATKNVIYTGSAVTRVN